MGHVTGGGGPGDPLLTCRAERYLDMQTSQLSSRVFISKSSLL